MKPQPSLKKSPAKAPAERVVKDIRRQTRRHFSAEDKIRIVLGGLRGEDSIAEHGTSWMLTRLVGQSRALDLLLSSRRVSGEEAFRIGLADRLCSAEDLIAETTAYARDLANSVSPRSTRIMKRQLWDALFVDLAASMADADHEMELSLRSADFREGVAHFVEKRPANFTGD